MPRRHYCAQCYEADPATTLERQQHAGVSFSQPRVCTACQQSLEPELFRRFDVARLKFRPTCAACSYDSHPESLSPYQRALVQVEREAGIDHTVWMRQSESLWNRRHYELMAMFAGVPVLPALRPVEKLYAYQAAGVAITSPEAACRPTSTTSSTTAPATTTTRRPASAPSGGPSPSSPSSSWASSSPAADDTSAAA
jgi:hypothetical protein